jgi:hypothetical protein
VGAQSYRREQLMAFGGMAGVLFLLLGATLAVAGIGWFKRRLWGWWLAVFIMAIRALGDLVISSEVMS